MVLDVVLLLTIAVEALRPIANIQGEPRQIRTGGKGWYLPAALSQLLPPTTTPPSTDGPG